MNTNEEATYYLELISRALYRHNRPKTCEECRYWRLWEQANYAKEKGVCYGETKIRVRYATDPACRHGEKE